MDIQIWSDFLCPYCLLGKKHLMKALEEAGVTDAVIEMKSFLLNPGPPRSGQGMRQHLKEKYGYTNAQVDENFESLTRAGAEWGLKMDFEKAVDASTDRAHALLQYAKTKGLGTALSDRLQVAGYLEGATLDDDSTLLRLAGEVGLSDEEAKAALDDDSFHQQACAEYRQALEYSARGVPFFVINERFAISGAQPVDVFVKTLKKAAGK